ncbi:hypothetical protein LUZ63_018332 [Rhynchospora breviuscula]|uniref:Protein DETOXIFICATION n=1 Tax=Rhynchospora breviuscula TaxID=2022672 RepID=A0A9Q0C444_9POAL|nr:hypothetical protein LUZ63_018332 [Rhynchospora breviuscula]
METSKLETVRMDVTKVGVVNGQDESSQESPPPPISTPQLRKTGLHLFTMNASRVFKLDMLGSEIMRIAIPAALALAADPIASLVDTAFMGQLGKTEVAAVGVSVAIFNQVSKIFIYPLVSVTTSFVAEEDALISGIVEEPESGDVEIAKSPPVEPDHKFHSDDFEKTNCGNISMTNECENPSKIQTKRKYIPSVSSALVVGAILGVIQAILLICGAKFFIRIMTGGKPSHRMLLLAFRYLTVRSLGAPAVLLSLAMIGVFRGFKDTKTPLYATVIGDIMNIILDAILIFVFHMGISGTAIAHVISQYIITLILFFRLVGRVHIIPPHTKSLKFCRFLECGFMLLARVIAVTGCMTLAIALASRQGDTVMAAFQISNQVWMSASLLTDGLAIAGQALLASAFAKSDHNKVVTATARVIQLSIALGICLTVLLGLFMHFGAGVFGKDADVIAVVQKAVPFAAGLQTINSLAFAFDGINFGASDYTFSASSMVMVATISVPCMIYVATKLGFIGIWISLAIYMILRTLVSIWRLGTATGPWAFLKKSL